VPEYGHSHSFLRHSVTSDAPQTPLVESTTYHRSSSRPQSSPGIKIQPRRRKSLIEISDSSSYSGRCFEIQVSPSLSQSDSNSFQSLLVILYISPSQSLPAVVRVIICSSPKRRQSICRNPWISSFAPTEPACPSAIQYQRPFEPPQYISVHSSSWFLSLRMHLETSVPCIMQPSMVDIGKLADLRGKSGVVV